MAGPLPMAVPTSTCPPELVGESSPQPVATFVSTGASGTVPAGIRLYESVPSVCAYLRRQATSLSVLVPVGLRRSVPTAVDLVVLAARLPACRRDADLGCWLLRRLAVLAVRIVRRASDVSRSGPCLGRRTSGTSWNADPSERGAGRRPGPAWRRSEIARPWPICSRRRRSGRSRRPPVVTPCICWVGGQLWCRRR